MIQSELADLMLKAKTSAGNVSVLNHKQKGTVN
jgi:hypothetical protein